MTAILFISLIVLLIIGVPIAFVLCGSSILAILASGDIHSAIVIQRMFSGCGSFTLLAIPFFVLAGNLMSAGGISKRLVNLCNSLFGHISGGLAMVAIITCAFFAAISGSSAATAAAVGTIIIPEMLNHKYDRNFAAATVASSAELGVIIPPSIGLIQYGVATVLLIMSASTIFGWILTKQQIPQAVAAGFLSISASKYVFLLLVNVLLLIIGMFCEAGAAMVILAPLLAPVAQTLGIDLVHFGVIMMANLAIGMMTPPVGVNLYVVCDTAKVKIEGMMPYLIKFFLALIAGVLVVTYVPQLSLLFVHLFGQ